jgi:hypothetical protein
MKTLISIAIWLLFAAVIPVFPYPFYLLLRLVVSVTCFYAVLRLRGKKLDEGWVKPALIVIGIVFNPVFPVHLTRLLWAPVDIICGVVLLKVRNLLR